MDRTAMAEVARRGWGVVADAYAEALFHELEWKPYDRELLARFASLVKTDLPVLDLGCGPGHVTAHLAKLGLRVRGIDLASEMIGVARERNPDLRFDVGDMLALDLEPNGIGGIVAFYSLISLVRADVPLLLQRLVVGLAPGAPLAIAVHAGEGEIRSNEVLGKKVEMIATLFTRDELTGYARHAGLTVDLAEVRNPYPEEYPTQRLYLLLRA